MLSSHPSSCCSGGAPLCLGGGSFTGKRQRPGLLGWFRSGEGQAPSAAPNKGSGLLPFVSLVYLKSPVALLPAQCPAHVAAARAQPRRQTPPTGTGWGAADQTPAELC